MIRCAIALPASRDLDEISDYFVSRNIEAGERLLRLFNEKCAMLMQFPNMGKSYDYIQPNLRGIPLNNYIIFYEMTADQITVLRIVNGRQNLTNVIKEDVD